MANVTIQMDKAVTGYGAVGDVITIPQTTQTDAMIANGQAHTYVGPATPTVVPLVSARSIIVAATAQTLSAASDVVIFLTAAPAIPTLPTAVGNSVKYIIKNTTGAAITPVTTSSQTIDGAAPAALAANGVLRLISDGANWRTV